MDYRIGIDAGSKTIKVVVVDEDGAVVHSVYRRHRSDIRTTLAGVLHDMAWRFGNLRGQVAVTGSAGIALAEMLGLPFVQEVVATTRAVSDAYPEADAFIELGGEDAKVVYLTGGLEQRMNATCAGGTGGFIDTIAFVIGARMSDMSGLALGARRIYPIASRCAVFAQTDVRPLLNAGARTADIAASALEAVVRQTLAGLACGRPLKGTIVFLGGPLEYIPNLVFRFRRALGLTRETGIKPPNAHLFTARGAALVAREAADDGTPPRTASLTELERQVKGAADPLDDLDHLPPLFADAAERAEFEERHAAERMVRMRLFDCEGQLYLGVDAGSTTVKCALVDDAGRLVHSDYRPVEGDVLKTAAVMLGDMYRVLPRSYGKAEALVHIAHATVTGYGEDLLRAALGIDSGVVETTAHVRAACAFCPEASFVLDIGGQDMKAIWVRDGLVSDAVLNEACSSGCGSFVEGTAHTLHMSPVRFSEAALGAKNPVDLGTKCTVFMTSRVRHAQKIGAMPADIAAGIAYSVVQNALYRIIGRDKVAGLGGTVVVQGGAFKSDAVLRAFELVAGVRAVRPDTAHLMGAIGAALVARDRGRPAGGRTGRSSLVDAARLGALAPKRSAVRCGGCGCACALTVVEFEGSRRFVSGNRCERAHAFLDGAAAGAGSSADRRQVVPRRDAGRAPNVVALERKLLARFGDVAGAGPRAEARVGLMDALNAYENLPFWHTLLRELGFSVLVPRRDEGAAAAEGLETIPSESVCQPAKVVHARFYDLAGRGARAVLMPRYERGSRCPVSSCYADAVRDSVPLVHEGAVPLVAPTLGAVRPEGIARSEADRAELLASLGRIAPEGAPLGADELEGALEAGLAAQRAFEDAVARATERALAWVHAVPGRHGAVLAGRPYHVDAALSHEVDGVVERLGLAVLPPLGLAGRLRAAREARSGAAWPASSAGDLASPPWKPAKRLVGLARFVAEDPSLELVCLRSFGCGFDALGADEARDVLEAAHRSFTVLKIDDIVDTAHLRIRLRTLAEAVEARDLRAAGEGFSDAAPARTTGGEPAGLGGSAETAVAAGVEDPSTPALRASAQDDKGDRPCASSRDGEGAVPLLGRIGRADLERARVGVNPDVCHTAASLAGRAARLVEADPSVRRLSVPRVCERCLLDALPRLVERACGRAVEIEWEDAWPSGLDAPAPLPAPAEDDRPRIGILGNALLCFDAYLNDGLVAFVERLGCRAVLPDPANLFVDDVRYGAQLDAFEAAGVDHVVYLQSFGCLKGHVHARGALHEAARRHPNMPVTVVDYDPEASALNRENRIRLAVAAARQARAKRPSGA
ncbi:BadF/BadG/BcrA/BcrD ATPase family protein [Gordonibacter massiliensis (ex Traore et al. 2017)]|uniref:BadF/BadG/BcrA/BcrD ATPase family protein n=1 Tax=Gordonibacter massiliensis (ex Traore et al. 2017) TaxID=1841863 RepID=UPI001C8C3FDA|nr:BadF/BadG/BcrA/BcrD ATPase family protein [Gordonibacter massiliensis (ex Traore et al. 2017)]MBX9033239.1 hypothetical protein [Gordonibacter massiliensis (ex Traore et al. 2017)]